MLFKNGKHILYGWQLNECLRSIWEYVHKFPHDDPDIGNIDQDVRERIEDVISDKFAELFKWSEINLSDPEEDDYE